MANKFKPHVHILPEDRANEEMAIGFTLQDSIIQSRIKVLPPAKGWLNVIESFEKDHSRVMDIYPQRVMVLLIDFDRDENRLGQVLAKIPTHLTDRVFVLGVQSEPEDIRKDLGSFEAIGIAMAKDCREQSATVWNHPLLVNNAPEIKRFRLRVADFIFS